MFNGRYYAADGFEYNAKVNNNNNKIMYTFLYSIQYILKQSKYPYNIHSSALEPIASIIFVWKCV